MSDKPILIVDDNATNLKLARVVLGQGGYATVTASDAIEALEVLRTCEPCLILMDLQLPGMDGFELTKMLKTDSRYRNIIILALTAYVMKGDEEKALAAGCDGYIAKPISTEVLPSIVAEYLSRGACSGGD